MNIAAAPGEAERAFALIARDVAMAPEKLPALLAAAGGLRQHVAAGRLNAVAVSDRIIEVAELHNLAELVEISEIARPDTMDPETGSDEEPIFGPDGTEPSITPENVADEEPVSPAAAAPPEHLERALLSLKPEARALEFVRGATGALRLAGSPEARISVIDGLHALGLRIGLSVPAVQGVLAAAAAGAAEIRRPIETYISLVGHQPPLPAVRPSAWRGVPLPEMRWIATHRIPADDATILSGDGGGGKTTVALQLAVSVERGLGDWLGTTVEAGPVIFFSAEEPDHEMRRRLVRVARKRGIDPDEIEGLHFYFASPENCLLAYAHADGTMWPTPLFGSLAMLVDKVRPALIVVDSIAATFGGNQNDRVHARTFVSLFRRLAQDAGCAVLLLDHPSLSGITSGTGRGGSMDWQNATRARLHLEQVGSQDWQQGAMA
ncbi:AAA family ATPase [Bradyrhizobium sp. 215_C5_N1_1]|uniref:AAA family ATPase n=1 Tax=unclassified Bradyrhizobium TaxID=2631580 RepID=UPI003F8CB64A